LASESKGCPGLFWQGADYPRVASGDYQAVCIGWQGPEWVRAYRRWSLRLEFSLFSENSTVSAFLNMGEDPARPHIGRRSKFYALWCQANGEMPRKGQQIALETFTEPGMLYLVRVENGLNDGKGDAKPDSLVYSRVTEILKVERSQIRDIRTPESLIHSSFKSNNQESLNQGITQSANQPIKKASAPQDLEGLVSVSEIVKRTLANRAASPFAGRRREQPRLKP
jgi:hypothetical protein